MTGYGRRNNKNRGEKEHRFKLRRLAESRVSLKNAYDSGEAFLSPPHRRQ